MQASRCSTRPSARCCTGVGVNASVDTGWAENELRTTLTRRPWGKKILKTGIWISLIFRLSIQPILRKKVLTNTKPGMCKKQKKEDSMTLTVKPFLNVTFWEAGQILVLYKSAVINVKNLETRWRMCLSEAGGKDALMQDKQWVLLGLFLVRVN